MNYPGTQGGPAPYRVFADSGKVAPEVMGEGCNKRALITGMGGFTGRYLSRQLADAGYRVFGTFNHGGAPAPASVLPGAHDASMFQVDVCDRDAIDAVLDQVMPDVVVHLAAISYVAHSNADDIYKVNLLGTRNLLAALAGRRHHPSAVLLASSGNVYGNANGGMIDEATAPAPVNDYAVSKLAMEAMARLWQDQLPIITARPFNYTGVGQPETFLIPKIVSHFRAGKRVIELGNTEVARDFSDVRFVCECYRRMLACAPAAAGQCFNICSGQAYSLADIIGIMSAIASYEIDVRVNPAFMRASEVRTLVGNNDKLSSVIGELAPTPIAETLCWMYWA